ncbi:MAG: L,D-transpeptidase family protein, partial [Bdellovibrionales bacterium]|nr:L,D-transpeptidase family protein [Bdellovibrionales bacterium]
TKNQLDYNEYGLRAFTLNYPNFFDQIENKTGYGIWLHAIPPTKSLKRGSRGCLVVRNEAIEKVKKYVDLNKTHVIVEDKIDYSPQENILKNKKDFFKWLEQWKISWEGKQISNYMNFYHDLFKANKMNKLQWQEYKSNLNEKYNYINVKLYSPVVFQHKDEIIVRFLQRYESDLNSDFGEKTLYVKKEAGQFKIIGEEWAPLSNNDMVATYESTKCAIPGC